ncbi:MAG: hypothetical protein JOY68_05365 [Candidatus Dormibacteraeota bacterium]|nr:hypothetical protein [Candidatus Dormibacteraeota bacterium]
MTLLTIAEVLAGELLVTPAGLVDRTTAVGDEIFVWQLARDHTLPLEHDLAGRR